MPCIEALKSVTPLFISIMLVFTFFFFPYKVNSPGVSQYNEVIFAKVCVEPCNSSLPSSTVLQ